MVDDVFHGFLFKRRGGLAKAFHYAWVQRYFVISKDGSLCYYENDSISDKQLPRGKVDLHTITLDYSAESGLDPSAPTEYIIQITPPNNVEKWKLCALNREDFQKWIKAIQRYTLLQEQFNPSQNNNFDRTRNSTSPSKPLQNIALISIPKPQIQRIKLATQNANDSWDMIEWYLALAIMNLCYYYSFSSSVGISILLILISNFVVGKTLYHRNMRTTSTNPSESQQVVVKDNPLDSNNTSVHSVISTTRPASSRPIPGSTYTKVNTPPKLSPAHTWCRIDASQFQVRGSNYNVDRKKTPSAPAIYEPFAVDVFCAKSRIDHAARRFELPEDLVNLDTKHPHIPPIFVIQIQIPSEPPPSMFIAVEDGPGWSFLLFFKISEDSLRQLQNFETASPAIKLFANYCEKAAEDPVWRARFKVICSCSNLDEMGVPGAISAYNAKPMLIRRTGSIFKGKGYIEINVHVHKFATMAKQSIHMLTSRCALMYMQIGFVVESRESVEQPETLFACVAINKPQEEQGRFLFED